MTAKVWLRLSPLAQALLIGFGLWVLLQILERTLWAWMLILLAVLLAATVAPVVRLIRRPRFPPRGWRVPRGVGVLLVYVGVLGLLALLGYLVGNAMIGQVSSLLQGLPEVAARASRQVNNWSSSAGLGDVMPGPNEIASQAAGFTGQATGILRNSTVLITGAVDFVLRAFLVLALALFLVVEAEAFLGFFVRLFPPKHRQKVRELTSETGYKVGRWIVGQLVVAATVGTMAWLASLLLGLPYPLLIGVVTACLELAPVVGATLMTIPAAFLGLQQSPLVAVLAALIFFSFAMLDGHVLSPLITGKAVRLSPALIIAALPFGLALYGPIGAFVAVPVAATLKLLVMEVLLPWLWEREGIPAEEQPQPEDEPRQEKAA